jgi:RNA polymerase primary sigma factor
MDLDLDLSEHAPEEPVDGQDILGIIRDQIFNLPLLPQKQVIELFHILDSSLQESVDEILARGNFVESYLSDVISEVAASVTHGRTIYGHSVKRRRSSEEDENEDANEDEATNAVFKRTSDVRFLEQSINILHLLASYQDTDEDAEDRKKLTRKILHDTNFVRLVYEEVIHQFLAHTKGYRELVMQATSAHNQLHSTAAKTEFSKLSNAYSELHDRMEAIERTVLGDRVYLYHLCELVDKSNRNQRKLRDMIYEPYLRIVYKEAKRHATNEQQVLDNFQNGSQGLLRAISCYNLDRNVSFSSYAHWWIRQSILFHIKDSSNFVKLPVTTWQTYTAVEREKSKIATKYGTDSLEVLAAETGHTEEKLKEIYDAVRSSHVHSLDYEMDESGKLLLSDVIEDASIEEREIQMDAQGEVIERLRFLSDDQRWATILTFGLFHLLDQDTIPDCDLLAERVRQRIAASRL